jgi:hypothetical protein
VTARVLLDEARRHGCQFEVDGDRIHVRAPAPLPSELREQLRAHRDELRLELLRRQEPDLAEGEVWEERLEPVGWRLRSRLLGGEEVWLAKDSEVAAELAAEFPGVAVFTLAEIPVLATKPLGLIKALVAARKVFVGSRPIQ